MKLRRDYVDFIDKLDQHHPRFGEQYRCRFPMNQIRMMAKAYSKETANGGGRVDYQLL